MGKRQSSRAALCCHLSCPYHTYCSFLLPATASCAEGEHAVVGCGSQKYALHCCEAAIESVCALCPFCSRGYRVVHGDQVQVHAKDPVDVVSNIVLCCTVAICAVQTRYERFPLYTSPNNCGQVSILIDNTCVFLYARAAFVGGRYDAG